VQSWLKEEELQVCCRWNSNQLVSVSEWRIIEVDVDVDVTSHHSTVASLLQYKLEAAANAGVGSLGLGLGPRPPSSNWDTWLNQESTATTGLEARTDSEHSILYRYNINTLRIPFLLPRGQIAAYALPNPNGHLESGNLAH